MSTSNAANTFHLTQEEDKRIRNAVQQRIQRCQDTSGSPRESRDFQALRSQATQESLLADMMEGKQDGQDSMVLLVVGSPHPPCCTSVCDLQHMSLAELLMDHHHRGRLLTVKRVAPVVVHRGRSWTVVQDIESDNAERFEIVLHKTRAEEEILESFSEFLIKEPYFTLNDQGEAAIIVNHPLDIVSNPFETDQTHLECLKSAQDYKDDGNACLKRGHLLEAHAAYTNGLKQARVRDGILFDLHRNRALVNLQLGCLDQAKADGLAAVAHADKSLDGKAYFRAACAAYNLGEYEEAKRLFQEQMNLLPDDQDGFTHLRRVEQRLHEQETGEYNFKLLKARLSKARPRADAATFNALTEVRLSCTPEAGKGLFARKDLREGDLILCEKAFCIAFAHENAWTTMTYDIRDDSIRGFPAGLGQAIVQKLLNNPSQVERFMDLFGDHGGIGKKLVVADGEPVVDTFQVHDIICRNAFACGAQYGEETVKDASTGFWILASRVNHSCVANVAKEFLGDLLILRAARPIKAGEELFQNYDASSDYDARQAALMRTWGFECSCSLCGAEKADGADTRKKRHRLHNQALSFVGREDPRNTKRLTVVTARRLANAISETYEKLKYQDLPRTALREVQAWLDAAKPC